MNRTRINRAVLATVAATCCLAMSIQSTNVTAEDEQPFFVGATPGSPVPFDEIPLPPVNVGPYNSPASMLAYPFIPSFDSLVNGETVITRHKEMLHVWRRLFATLYDPSLFDFENEFVILVGGGLMHPDFDFYINSVEQFDANFTTGGQFPTQYVEMPLAVIATTVIPGVEPPKADPVFKISAVVVPNEFYGDVLFNRQDKPLP